MPSIGEDQILEIARVVHGASRAYDCLLGKPWQPIWEHASGWYRAAVIAGVKAVVSGEGNTPEELHDARSRTPGDLRTFDALSIDQRRRIALFRAVVLALVDGPCEYDCHDPSCAIAASHPCHLGTCLSEFGVPSPETPQASSRQ